MEQKRSGFSTAALVLGIIAIVMLVSCCFTVLCFLPAIAGIICALISKSRTVQWEGTALGGFICSVITIVIFVIILILGVFSYSYIDHTESDSIINRFYDGDIIPGDNSNDSDNIF